MVKRAELEKRLELRVLPTSQPAKLLRLASMRIKGKPRVRRDTLTSTALSMLVLAILRRRYEGALPV